MGLFSSIFGGGKKSVRSAAISTSFLGTYRVASGKSYDGGGWGLDRFNSVVAAHSSVYDMVDEFGLAEENCKYPSVDGYANPWTQAYNEEYERASMEAEELRAFGLDVDPEELLDWDVIEENANEYACELAQAWLDGDIFVPEEVLDWAWYSLSDHNMGGNGINA